MSTPTAEATSLAQAFDERFATNARRWPDDVQSTAWLVDGGYRLEPRQAGQFVAIRVPSPGAYRDVRVTGLFRKLGGPPGGGYGLVVGDQSPAPLDGVLQTGRFYLCEVSDRGEVGIWLRDGNTWVDLLPWTASAAVRRGTEPNELVCETRGPRLSFRVNGAMIADVQESVVTQGAVGVFAGGDGNQTLLEHLTVEPL